MTTPLEKSLKRELEIRGDHYTLTISPEGLKLVPKGKRNGVELKWQDLVSGQAALAVALNASLDKLGSFPETRTKPAETKPRHGKAAVPNAGSKPADAKSPREAAAVTSKK